MPLAPGTQLGPYEIASAIGAGGMGEVYRARDAKLDRDVAIKVLPEAFARDEERLARFEREVKAVAALSHPNILAIHDFGNDEGTVYAVTELLEGRTLREHLEGGALPTRKAIEYARQIGEGLGAAHEKGIVHRDLKPENVFITDDGRVKILDFGLAKFEPGGSQPAGSSPTLDRVTGPGVVMGTVGYMSPEQVRGQEVDPRSDLFSLGVILYEMLSGQRAFRGESAVETMNAILKEDPPDLSRSSSTSPGLDSIVRRCLEKSPAERFQSARDLGFALGSVSAGAAPAVRVPIQALVLAGIVAALAVAGALLWTSGTRETTSAERKRIVILPFENLGNEDDAHFASGMTEEITSRLAVVSGIGVISRTSALQYEGSRKTSKQIGEELDVDYILEGTVRWERVEGEAGRVRVTPQLIRVEDDTHVWAERYDRTADEIFRVQSDIAGNVIEQLNVALLGSERQALEVRPTENMEAYEAYLRGLSYFQSSDLTENDSQLTISMFERAVELDPDFAIAYARLAQSHSWFFHAGYDRTDARLTKARRAADRALELRPELPEAHLALGLYYYWGFRDYGGALAEIAVAQKGLPNSREIFEALGYIERRQGLIEESIRDLEKAMELDPLSSDLVYEHSTTLTWARRYADAETYLNRAIALTPDRPAPYYAKAENRWLWDGDLDQARSALERMPKTGNPSGDYDWIELWVLERQYEKALEHLASTHHSEFIWDGYFAPASLVAGDIYRYLGRLDEARKAYGEARTRLEVELRQRPDDPQVLASLGLACAGLGLESEALEPARRAVALYPVSLDAMVGPARVLDLARVQTMLGRYDEALELLDSVLSAPAYFSVAVLELDPMWDPLRDHPRYRALIKKYR